MTIICVDTTELFQAPGLDRAGWPELLAWCRREAVTVVLSEVVLREADRHYREKALEELQGLRRSVQRFEHLEQGRQLDLEPLAAELTTSISKHLEGRRKTLLEHGVVILPIPTVPHGKLLDRDLAHGKPFQESGKGYRDALTWEALLGFLADEPPQNVFLVSGDADFAARADKETLDAQLADEVRALGHRAELVKSLPVAVERLRSDVFAKLNLRETFREDEEEEDEEDEDEEPTLVELVTEAVVSAVEALSGEPIAEESEDGRATGPGVALSGVVPRGLSEATIGDVNVDEGSVVVDVYDVYEGDTFATHADIDAELDIEGFADKSDVYGMDDVTILDDDWNEHMMWLSVPRQARLSFYVTVVGGSVEEIRFDVGQAV